MIHITVIIGGMHFSPHLCHSKCFLIWRARWSDRAKARSHMLHLYGLCPVCFLMCRPSSSDRENFQPQPCQVQRYGFSPVWVLIWAFMWEALWYSFPQPGWMQVCITGFFFTVLLLRLFAAGCCGPCCGLYKLRSSPRGAAELDAPAELPGYC